MQMKKDQKIYIVLSNNYTLVGRMVCIREKLHSVMKGRREDRDAKRKAFICSEWAEDILRECGINVFRDKMLYTVWPADFYHELKEYIVYQGLTKEYDEGIVQAKA